MRLARRPNPRPRPVALPLLRCTTHLIAMLSGMKIIPAHSAASSARPAEIIPGSAPSLAIDKDGKFWCAFVRQGNVMMFSSADGSLGRPADRRQLNGRAPGASSAGRASA